MDSWSILLVSLFSNTEEQVMDIVMMEDMVIVMMEVMVIVMEEVEV